MVAGIYSSKVMRSMNVCSGQVVVEQMREMSGMRRNVEAKCHYHEEWTIKLIG
jgi:hypothetical protein